MTFMNYPVAFDCTGFFFEHLSLLIVFSIPLSLTFILFDFLLMDITDNTWKDEVYQQSFENVTRHIKKMKDTDASFTLKELEGMLQAEYVNQGNDWVGRGELYDLRNAATIAAYQMLIAEWEKEKSQ